MLGAWSEIMGTTGEAENQGSVAGDMAVTQIQLSAKVCIFLGGTR